MPSGFVKEIYDKESLKVNNTTVKISVNTITGREGDFWICLSPSLDVSGYGETREEARTSFDENVQVFCNDFLDLNPKENKSVLLHLGWSQKKYASKQYSKAFVDEDGVLQDLEEAKVSLETVA